MQLKMWHKLGGGVGVLMLIVLVIVLSVVFTRHKSVRTTTRPTHASSSLPAVDLTGETLVELANTIMAYPQEPFQAWVGYTAAFKSRFYKDGLVQEPQYHVTDKTNFVLQCTNAYGAQDGTVIADAAWRSYGMVF